MLRRLTIRNYTLIEHLEVDLQQGFTAITGETGSGKSIILGALGLLLGNRAEGNLLHDPERKCVIEAHWDTASDEMQSFLRKHELDLESESVLRREITPSGKSRLFFNDTPVTAAVMKAFREGTIDIHSQHEHSTLKQQRTQLNILDAFAKQESEVASYARLYKDYQVKQQELDRLLEEQQQSERDKDYRAFQLNELNEAQLDQLLERNLESELQTLTHAEEIRNYLQQAARQFEGEAYSPGGAIQHIKSLLLDASRLSPGLAELSERMESLSIEWADLEAEVSRKAEETEVDDEQLAIVRDQYDQVQRLLHKHQLQTVEELRLLEQELASSLESTEAYAQEIAEAQKDLEVMLGTLRSQAQNLSAARNKACQKVAQNIGQTLADLSMPYAEVDIRLEPLDEPGTWGMDKVHFHFKTNKGGEFGPIEKVASGGELSRMMLALKGAIAEQKALPVMIFDEIDTGVSGEVAHQMGTLMRSMSEQQQLIAITHLPQIAGKAHQHWQVSKDDSQLKTVSLMKVLSPEERVEEIAIMLSGDKLTDAALKQARVLLEG